MGNIASRQHRERLQPDSQRGVTHFSGWQTFKKLFMYSRAGGISSKVERSMERSVQPAARATALVAKATALAVKDNAARQINKARGFSALRDDDAAGISGHHITSSRVVSNEIELTRQSAC